MRRLLPLVLLALAACAPNAPAALPTLTLVPPTATQLPTTIPPTETPDENLTSAESLLTPTAQVEPTSDNSSLAESDPIAAELAALAQARVSDETELPTSRIRVVSVEAVRWSDTSLGCPQAEGNYEAVEIDGYRIVLTAGETTYIFHTDFDRVLPCDEGDEVLPDD